MNQELLRLPLLMEEGEEVVEEGDLEEGLFQDEMMNTRQIIKETDQEIKLLTVATAIGGLCSTQTGNVVLTLLILALSSPTIQYKMHKSLRLLWTQGHVPQSSGRIL